MRARPTRVCVAFLTAKCNCACFVFGARNRILQCGFTFVRMLSLALCSIMLHTQHHRRDVAVASCGRGLMKIAISNYKNEIYFVTHLSRNIGFANSVVRRHRPNKRPSTDANIRFRPFCAERERGEKKKNERGGGKT